MHQPQPNPSPSFLTEKSRSLNVKGSTCMQECWSLDRYSIQYGIENKAMQRFVHESPTMLIR